jgi:hypothetical protein
VYSAIGAPTQFGRLSVVSTGVCSLDNTTLAGVRAFRRRKTEYDLNAPCIGASRTALVRTAGAAWMASDMYFSVLACLPPGDHRHRFHGTSFALYL